MDIFTKRRPHENIESADVGRSVWLVRDFSDCVFPLSGRMADEPVRPGHVDPDPLRPDRSPDLCQHHQVLPALHEESSGGTERQKGRARQFQ